jgi:hypothetical protein
LSSFPYSGPCCHPVIPNHHHCSHCPHCIRATLLLSFQVASYDLAHPMNEQELILLSSIMPSLSLVPSIPPYEQRLIVVAVGAASSVMGPVTLSCHGVSCFEVCVCVGGGGGSVMRWQGWGHFACLPHRYHATQVSWHLHRVSYPQTTPSHPIWTGRRGWVCIIVGSRYPNNN